LATGAALPWWPDTRAEASSPPRRLLLVHFAHGVAADRWRPQPGPGWIPGQTLEPLAPWADRVTQILGLANHAGRAQIGDIHKIAMGTLTTCTGLAADEGAGGHYLPGGPSFDRVIAQQLAAADDAPPHTSLHLGVRTLGFAMSAAAEGAPLRADDDPHAAFAAIFGELALTPEARAAAVARRTAARTWADARLATLTSLLPAGDHPQLAAHRAALAAIAARDGREIALPPSCLLPPSPAAITTPRTPANEDVPSVVDAVDDLVVAALGCDLSRVVTLQWGSSGNDGLRHVWQGIDADYHSTAHLANGDDDVAHEQHAAATRWYVERFAGLLARLAAIPEGDGSVLDHTTCVLVSGLSVVHDLRDLPVVVVGGGVPGGRVLDAGDTSITALWRGLAAHMGVELGEFGAPAFDAAPLEL
jgi:hypothetical protein